MLVTEERMVKKDRDDDKRTADRRVYVEQSRRKVQKKGRARRVDVAEALKSVKFSKLDRPHLTVNVKNKLSSRAG